LRWKYLPEGEGHRGQPSVSFLGIEIQEKEFFLFGKAGVVLQEGYEILVHQFP
jgi:hypothetical protein